MPHPRRPGAPLVTALPRQALLTGLALCLAALGPGAGTPPRADADPQPRPHRADQVSGTRPSATPPARSPHRPKRTVTVVAVGDVACAPGQARRTHRCRQADTAALARSMHPDAVLALGDLQYESGGLRAFRRSYDATWGRLKAVTFPVPGNHEYRTPAASGYYTYFDGRQPGAPGWYVRRLGAWRVYFLNSNCDHVDCATEARWLRGALDRHPARCSAVVTHHPRYSSGEHGPDPALRPFFRIAVRHRVELVLSGHDHDYERFARMGAHGRPTRAGTIQIVSGLGGRSTYPVGEPARGSRARVTGRFGVLRLSLHRGGFRFAFTAVGGRVLDRGHRSCR